MKTIIQICQIIRDLEGGGKVANGQRHYHIPTWGLGSWDPAAKEHMMAYDKQLKDFTTMYDEEATI
jgi:hypothetical protein